MESFWECSAVVEDVMSSFPREGPDGIVSISSTEKGTCVKVDPKSAQSLIRFLLDKGIELDPPEGGVARDPKYQIEMGGVPQMHEFRALIDADKLNELAAEWESNPTPPVA